MTLTRADLATLRGPNLEASLRAYFAAPEGAALLVLKKLTADEAVHALIDEARGMK